MLYKTRTLETCCLERLDGETGHVEDSIIDDETWMILYPMVDIGSLWPGKKVLIAPEWIGRVSCSESKGFVNRSREAILVSPEYMDESLIGRDDERGPFGSYHCHGCWLHKAEREDPAETVPS